jgi:hypothetical protein
MTFDAPVALPPGKYTVRTLVDGRVVHERNFEVTPGSSSSTSAVKSGKD